MSLSRSLSRTVLLSPAFVLAMGSAVASEGEQQVKPEKTPAFSCFSDTYQMSKRQKMAHLFNATVVVEVTYDPPWEENPSVLLFTIPKEPGTGTGFLIDSEGYIVTNAHVVEDNYALSVVLYDPEGVNGLGERVKAKLVGKDERTDLAVLKIDTENSFSCLKFSDSNNIDYGDVVSAIGHPKGEYFTLTRGSVSFPNRTLSSYKFNDLIQTDVAINSGNSGGPLFTEAARIVGVNQSILTTTGGSMGISFSIPSNIVVSVADELIRKGKIEEGDLGASFDNPSQGRGALITKVLKGGAGAVAGLEEADVIIKANGKAVRVANDFERVLAYSDPGDVLKMRVWRGGQEVDLVATLGSSDALATNSDKFASNKSVKPAASIFQVKPLP